MKLTWGLGSSAWRVKAGSGPNIPNPRDRLFRRCGAVGLGGPRVKCGELHALIREAIEAAVQPPSGYELIEVRRAEPGEALGPQSPSVTQEGPSGPWQVGW